ERHDDLRRVNPGALRRSRRGHQQQQQGGRPRLRALPPTTPRQPAALPPRTYHDRTSAHTNKGFSDPLWPIVPSRIERDRIHSIHPDGSDRKTIATNCRLPDGIAVDVAAGHIYWTNMGVPNLEDGSIERADLDGKHRKVIVPQGGTYTPKQLHLDKENGKLY